MAELAQNQEAPPSEFFIVGVTSNGRQFRPSDWADRLCGVMSCFNPDGNGGRNARIAYSPYVRPTLIDGIRAVVVDVRLRELEPLAFHFVLNFAKDNDLKVIDAQSRPYTG
jgi:hypothetical protein